jgi:acetyl esterase/lipase
MLALLMGAMRISLWICGGRMGKGPHALAIAIHGGYWRAKYDLGYMGHLCAALTANGNRTANLEYRRVGNSGGGWPGTLRMCARLISFCCRMPAKYEFDARRIVALGHSAGGQLGLCLAAHETGVKAVISLAGVVDLQRAYNCI